MRISDWSSDVCSSDLGERRQRLLAARQQRHDLQALARRARHDLQAGGQRILGFGELQVRPAAAEEAHEELLEVGVHRLEGRQEAFSSLAVQAGDALAQAGDGVHQVAARSEEHTSELQSLMRNSYA